MLFSSETDRRSMLDDMPLSKRPPHIAPTLPLDSAAGFCLGATAPF